MSKNDKVINSNKKSTGFSDSTKIKIYYAVAFFALLAAASGIYTNGFSLRDAIWLLFAITYGVVLPEIVKNRQK